MINKKITRPQYYAETEYILQQVVGLEPHSLAEAFYYTSNSRQCLWRACSLSFSQWIIALEPSSPSFQIAESRRQTKRCGAAQKWSEIIIAVMWVPKKINKASDTVLVYIFNRSFPLHTPTPKKKTIILTWYILYLQFYVQEYNLPSRLILHEMGT